MKNWLVIDDERSFVEKPDDTIVIYARTSTDGLMEIQNFVWDAIFLDHDLGGLDTIMPVVNKLCELAYIENKHCARKIFVHTANASVADTMVRTLNRYNCNAEKKDAISLGLEML